MNLTTTKIIDPGVRESVSDPFRLARKYAQARQALLLHRDKWYQFDGLCYQEKADADLRAEVTAFIKTEFNREAGERKTARAVTRGLVADTMQALTAIILVPSSQDMPVWLGPEKRNLIVVSNGLLDMDRLLAGDLDPLEAHSPLWFSTISLGYAYDAAARAPRWMRFLEETFERDPERIALLQEIFGYLLTTDTSLQMFFVLMGEAGTGKSTILEVLVAPSILFKRDQRVQLGLRNTNLCR